MTSSPDPDQVMTGYRGLAYLKFPLARETAVAHLESADDYIWLNAALYLGAIGGSRAVPYLIKARRHTAWRSDVQTLSALKAIAHQEKIEPSFTTWRQWWQSAHPGRAFDWDSKLGHAPRM